MASPKTKITFEKEEISDRRWGSGKYDELMAIPTKDFAECFEQWKRCWENCSSSQGAYFEGDWGVSVLRTMFLTFCIFFDKCLYFSYYMAGYFLDSPCIHPWYLIFWLSSLYMFVFIQKKIIKSNIWAGEVSEIWLIWQGMTYILTDLDRFN